MLSTIAIPASRKRVTPFRLHRPRSLAEVLALLAEHGDDAALHAGGIDLVSRMKAGVRVRHLIALDGIASLSGIRDEGDALWIGAMTRHRAVETDPVVLVRMPSLAEYVAGLGNIRIRMQGTIGGNVMAREAAYEMLPALVALEATLVFRSVTDDQNRMIPASEVAQATPPRLGVLLAIVIPMRARVLGFARDLRAAAGLSVVASIDLSQGAPSGIAVLVGDWRGPLAAPFGPTSAAASSPSAIARAWAASLPAIDAASGASATYCARVASVLLERALASGNAHG